MNIKPIKILKYDEHNEVWNPLALDGETIIFHAKVNKSGGSEYLGSGSTQSTVQKVFRIRYSSIVADIELNTQLYRIEYDGVMYDVTDYDDFNDLHREVKLLAEARGVNDEH